MRRIVVAVCALLCGVSAFSGVHFSGATWTYSTTSPVAVAAAYDWTPPTVSLSGVPSGVAAGTTVTVTATVSDTRSAIAAGTPRIEVAPSTSGTWTALTGCTTSGTNPLTYTCSWATTGLTGDYKVRASAADTAANVGTSATRTTTVTAANSGVVVLDTIADAVRATVPLTATLYTTSNADTTLDLSYRPVGGTTWTQICLQNQKTDAKSVVLTCSWNTVGLADGPYEIQAHGKVQGTDSYDTQTVVVDNAVPSSATISVPTGVLGGSVQLTGTAADTTSGVASMTFQYRTGTAAWTDCGTDTTSPYACRLDTTGLVNGATYELRAVATDGAGNTTSSATVSRTVDNTPATVAVTSPADGTVVDKGTTVAVSAQSARGVTQVRVQARPAGGVWSDVCTDTTSPYSCAWDTSALASTSYDLRAVLSQGSGGDVVSAVVSVGVDHNPGTVAITGPAGGAAISHQNAVTVTGTTAAPSGVTSVVLKATPVSPSGAGTTTTCSLGSGTFSCAWDTSAVVYGSYELRAQMKQGNTVTVTSSPVSVSVDNVTGSVSLTLTPGASNGYVRGTETLTAAASSNAGITSVRYDVSPAGAGTWTAVCAAASSAPYSCAWNTLSTANAGYDLRAVMTLANGSTVVSDPVRVTVANLRAADVQAGNGDGTVAAGDTLTLAYSTRVDLGSIRAGWGGGSTPVAMTLQDVSGQDRIAFTDANLGQVAFGQDYVSAGSTLSLSGTMTAALVNGATVVTVTLGSVSGAKASAATGTMTWTPSTAATDFYLGGACLATAATESGALDRDL